MDREDNLPFQSEKPPKSLVRDVINQDPSSSQLLRHVQAAFKRHRPLNKMLSTTIGPRRSVVAQRKASVVTSSTDEEEDLRSSQKDVVSLSQNLAANTLTHDSGNLAPSVTIGESMKNASVDNNMCGGRQMDSSKPDVASLETNIDKGSRNENVQRKVQSLTVTSHESYLLFADMEWDATNQAQASNIGSSTGSRHQNLDSEYKVSCSLAKIQGQIGGFRSFLNQPATQCSAVGSSSSATTTLIHSSSAPMLNSTTHVSRSYVEADTNAIPHAAQSQANLPPSSSSKDSNIQHADKDIQQVRRVEETDNKSKHQQLQCTTELEGPGVSSTNELLTSVTSQTQKTDKHEKVTTTKKGGTTASASAPRKRNYDPELFFKVNGKLYQRLGKIGSGGSSEVHKVISSDCTIYALKKIKLKGRDYATAYGFCQEIGYLEKLKGKPNIIQLIDYEVTDKRLLQEVLHGTMSNKDGRVRDDGFIYMVLEYGEIDLAHMLSQKWKEIEGSDRTIDENWLRFYWQQILEAVNTIHEERIVHSDLKPANFLLVKGFLKLIDFGIAKAINSDTTNIQRDSQVGTLSYMSPEAFMCNESDENGNTIKCGRPSDIWSLGCILYQMVYGRTPFADYKTFWAKFKVITDPNHEIAYNHLSNPWLIDLMKKCLAWDRNKRWRIPELLQHPFLAPPIIHHEVTTQGMLSTMISQLEQQISDPGSVSENDSRDLKNRLLLRISELCVQLQRA
ncbi:unnamed protein product [Cochlearia groenlandica]